MGRFRTWSGPKSVLIIAPTLALLLLLAVACGAAATSTTAPAATPAPNNGAGPAPTAVPQATPNTGVPVVNPGKLTAMVGDFGDEKFDPAIAAVSRAGAHNFGRTLNGFLISIDGKGQMTPGIASDWSLSADGLTWTFNIRKGVKFHNGAELTPKDVQWSMLHTYGPQAIDYVGSTPLQALSKSVDRIELSGVNAVSVTNKQPLANLAIQVSEAGTSWYPIIPGRAALRNEAEELAYQIRPVGAGPMQLEKQVPAYSMSFRRFDDFYYQPKNGLPEDKRVKFQSMDIFLVPEEATRVAALRAGDADIVPASLGTKKQVEAGGGRLVFGQEGVAMEVWMLGCYETKHPCNKKGVRQALNYAIDKNLIRERLYGAEVFQVKGWNPVTPSTIGYTPALDPFPFDPAKARQLLADAGYPGGAGFGKLVVNTFVSSSMPLQIEAAQLGAEFWKRELGLDVELKVGDGAALNKAWRVGELNGQILWQDQGTRIDATSFVGTRYSDPKSVSRVHEDPELFRLSQETLAILDPVKRTEALKVLYLRLREESHFPGIGYFNIPWGVGPRVVTWQPTPLAQWVSALHTITLK